MLFEMMRVEKTKTQEISNKQLLQQLQEIRQKIGITSKSPVTMRTGIVLLKPLECLKLNVTVQ